jgi:hypothetical protein
MKGADYVATERLTNRAGAVVAAKGETCERVDPKSLPWLLDGGHIAPKPTRAKTSKQQPNEGGE